MKVSSFYKHNIFEVLCSDFLTDVQVVSCMIWAQIAYNTNYNHCLLSLSATKVTIEWLIFFSYTFHPSSNTTLSFSRSSLSNFQRSSSETRGGGSISDDLKPFLYKQEMNHISLKKGGLDVMQSQLLHTMQYAPGLISYALVTGRWKLP